ncbi:MAG: response regulator [Anaerolineae bacterium]|nr:response regulator [Anaerolineae bacterium]
MADKHTILIVEDDYDLLKMLEAYFSVQGYDVLTAPAGEDGLRLAQESAPDLVVLDIRLPDIDGYEVCRRLRSQRRTQDIPIIFLTEKSDRIDRLQGLELGVVDYIIKPFDIQELRLRIRNALRRAIQQPLSNPVTKLPDSVIVHERLEKLLLAEDWAALTVIIDGLDAFREQYGFVASDDVLRAVSLMMHNALRESGAEEDFIGHLNQHTFVILTSPGHVEMIRERIAVRIRQSMAYFYPIKTPETPVQQVAQTGPLAMKIGLVQAANGPFEDLEALQDAIEHSRQPV